MAKLALVALACLIAAASSQRIIHDGIDEGRLAYSFAIFQTFLVIEFIPF